MKYIAIILLALLPSCLATSGDLESIAVKMQEGEQRIAQKQAEFAQGLASAEEVTEAISDAWGGNVRQVEQVAENIKERSKNIWEQVLVGAIGAIPVAGAGAAALNAHRNRTRETDPRVSNRMKGGDAA